MPTRTHVLISEGFNLGVSIGGSTNKLQPPNRVDWNAMYDEVEFNLTIPGITDGGTQGNPTGTFPTAWSLFARFERRQMHGDGTTARFQKPRWWNLSEREMATYTVEGVPLRGPGLPEPTIDPIVGVGDGLIASEATPGYNATGAGIKGLFTNPVRITRRFKHIPPGLRMVIPTTASSFTGGTAPRFVIGLEVTGFRKGN